jgi:hypothetical protein
MQNKEVKIPYKLFHKSLYANMSGILNDMSGELRRLYDEDSSEYKEPCEKIIRAFCRAIPEYSKSENRDEWTRTEQEMLDGIIAKNPDIINLTKEEIAQKEIKILTPLSEKLSDKVAISVEGAVETVRELEARHWFIIKPQLKEAGERKEELEEISMSEISASEKDRLSKVDEPLEELNEKETKEIANKIKGLYKSCKTPEEFENKMNRIFGEIIGLKERDGENKLLQGKYEEYCEAKSELNVLVRIINFVKELIGFGLADKLSNELTKELSSQSAFTSYIAEKRNEQEFHSFRL